MPFKLVSFMLKRMLGIALPKRGHDLTALTPMIDEITAETWFDPSALDAFRQYAADHFASADMDERQKRSLLISIGRRYHSRT